MFAEEAKLSLGRASENNLDFVEGRDLGEDEGFYEKIEAPKFVDFTVPNHYGPDDRYWFCLRVGCDQKHEEEMDSEAIYKQFVLRVMAARSPNIRLHKALHRNDSSKNTKSSLSVPPKASKSVLPRFTLISSLSKRIGDDIIKAKNETKVSSTPKAKGKQVSSKYLTTPSYKNCPPNPKTFQTVVGKQKSPTLLLPKTSRTVAKTLTFQSPRKVLILKKSMELHTPVTKLCEGMKNLEITSQRNRVLGYSSKTTNNSQKMSKRQKDYNLEKPNNKMSRQPPARNDQDTKSSSRLIKHRKAESGRHTSIEAAKDACSVIDMPVTTKNNIDSVSVNVSEGDKGIDDNPRLSSKENEREYTDTERATCESVCTESDQKENASTAIDKNRCEVLGIHNSEGKKDTPNAVNKNLIKFSAAGMKMVKPKPTNPKPFRLRTDERRILKENKSDRKHEVLPPKEVPILSIRKDGDIQKGCTRIVAARTPEHHMVRKTPINSLKSHNSKHKDVKPATSSSGHQSNSCRDVKNILRKSTFSSRMHAMASKLTPFKQVTTLVQNSAPERKFNVTTNIKV